MCVRVRVIIPRNHKLGYVSDSGGDFGGGFSAKTDRARYIVRDRQVSCSIFTPPQAPGSSCAKSQLIDTYVYVPESLPPSTVGWTLLHT